MLPFLDEEGLAQLWQHIIARLNNTASDEELAMLEASLRNALNSKAEKLSDLGVVVTADELNHIEGVTSPIQNQINSKSSLGHIHSASEITSGTISDDRLPITSIAKGGTNATTAEDARTNLDVYSKSQTQSLVNEAYTYADTVKSDLLNGASAAYDTLKELGELIDDNTDAIDRKVSKSGDTMSGSLKIYKDNPYLELKDNAYDTIWYIQAYQDTIAFGPTYVSAVKTDKNGNMTVPGTVYGSVFKTDTTEAAIKPSDSNEVSFGSNANYIYFGYENHVGSSGIVDTYKFGTHSGVDGATSGNIECGTVKVGNSKLVYDLTNECLNFTF